MMRLKISSNNSVRNHDFKKLDEEGIRLFTIKPPEKEAWIKNIACFLMKTSCCAGCPRTAQLS